MSSEAARAAKRRYYHRNRQRILAQQKEYRRRKRAESAFRARLAENTRRWRARFKDTMHAWGFLGRSGAGLSPEGWRYREARGLPVPVWPTLVDPSKQRRRTHNPRTLAQRPGEIAEDSLPLTSIWKVARDHQRPPPRPRHPG